MGFHLLTHSNKKVTNVKGGLSLTLSALATFCKYPRGSFCPNVDKNRFSEKKAGIFSCDLPIYADDIATPLGITKKNKDNAWIRHPLAFLNEAADDICYTISDFEDGYKHGLIPYQVIKDYYTEIANVYPEQSRIENIEKIINPVDKIGYLRAKAINSIIYQAAKVFIEKEKDILSGEFDQPLCKNIPSSQILRNILIQSKNEIYTEKSVLQIETAGFQVLDGLLDRFLTALKESKKESSKKLLQLIPEQYIFDFDTEMYNSILSIVSYIAGMTDNFAVDTYRNISGIQLPNYR